jgi:hypothetical protein
MTGFESKRQAAQDKLTDEADTQVYSDTLLIVYQRGFADGKRSAERKPLTEEEIFEMNDKAFDKYITREARAMEFARAIEAAHNIKEQP